MLLHKHLTGFVGRAEGSGQDGFTLIEIIAVLVLLAVLAAVAMSRYMDLIDGTKTKVVNAQFAEVSGRLKVVEAGFHLLNARPPDNGQELLTYATAFFPGACPDGGSTREGDFTYFCSGNATAQKVTITISGFQSDTFTPPETSIFTF